MREVTRIIKKGVCSVIIFTMILAFSIPCNVMAASEPSAPKSIELEEGETARISVKGSYIKSKKFKSDDTEIAVVSKKGIVTAVSGGRCTITATVKYKKNKKDKKFKTKKLKTTIIVYETDDEEDDYDWDDDDDDWDDEDDDYDWDDDDDSSITVSDNNTSSVSDGKKSNPRRELANYITQYGSYNDDGDKEISWENESGSSDYTVSISYDSKGDELTFALDSVSVLSDGEYGIAAGVIQVPVDNTISYVGYGLSFYDYNFNSDGDTIMLVWDVPLSKIKSDNNSFNWTVKKKTGGMSYLTDYELKEVADQFIDLLYSSSDILLAREKTGLNMMDLGFGY